MSDMESDVIAGIKELVAELNNTIDVACDLGLNVKIRQRESVYQIEIGKRLEAASNVTVKIWREY